MLLAVDVGNTHTVLGLFDAEHLVCDWRISTRRQATSDELGSLVNTLVSLRARDTAAIQALVVSSVVPALSEEYARFGRQYLGCATTVVNEHTVTGMQIRSDNPHEVGADRIVNAVAAYDRYGRACIVIDMGTATTFDAISDDGAYLGGAIAPGLAVSMEALTERAARLATVELAVPDQAIGTNTETSMQSGAMLGTIAQVEGMIDRFRTELGSADAPAVGTGGLMSVIAPHIRGLDAVDPLLTLKGLALIASRQPVR